VVRPARVVDHIRPVRRGGAFWDIHNLQTMCESCHNSKSGKESHGIIEARGGRGLDNEKGKEQKTIESKYTPYVEFFKGES
jgi:5-methylcytosine-specific restriction endonuclease McrA